MTKKIKNILTVENLLMLLIIICPILDMSSFLFRKSFNTSVSISTVLRPIIPIIAALYIFIKEKQKKPAIIISAVYGIYAICHLYVFFRIHEGCAYGNLARELQYLINYTFMIMNLVIFWHFFASKNREKEVTDEEKGKTVLKLKKCVLLALTIYIVAMYISILTGTASYTYPETMLGYKGWFESGNSIGTIMLLSLFITVPLMSKKYDSKIRIWSLMVTILVGTYLATLLGTRTGLFGFILVIGAYIFFDIVEHICKNNKINKKVIVVGTIAVIVVAIIVAIFGSKTLQRRKELKENEDLIYDPLTNQTAHVTGDIMQLVLDIQEGKIPEDYMSKDMQEAYLNLYKIANEKQISNTNMRMLQLVYQTELIKLQDSIPVLLFGNGYMNHFFEMIFEMEVPAFLYNFGIVGFFLYFVPFLLIALYSIYVIIKNIKKSNVEGMMISAGLCFAIAISFVAGYTFFNSSSMMIIIVLTVLNVNHIKDIEDDKIKIYTPSRKEIS